LRIRVWPPKEIPPFKDPEKEAKRIREFREKLVYFDAKEKTARYIIEMVQQRGAQFCLLSGPPSSRKTTFILALANFLKSSYLTYYFRAKSYDYESLLQTIRDYDQEKAVFIIDDCDYLPEDVGKFILDITSNIRRAKFIFVSRDITYDSFEKEEHNYFENEKVRKIPWFNEESDVENAVKGIIKQFCDTRNLKNCEKLGEDLGKIIEKCGKNFYVLNKFLETWERMLREGKSIKLDKIPIESVYEEFYKKYFTYGKAELKDRRNSLMAHFCAIYQFEIPISKDFLDKEGIGVYGSPDLEECLRELKSRGLLFKERSFFLLTQHPYFCKMFLDVAEEKRELRTLDGGNKDKEDFVVEVCKKYLLRTKDLQLVERIYRNRELRIGKRVVEDQNSIEVIRDFLKTVRSFVKIGFLLRILDRFEIAEDTRKVIVGEDLLEKWIEDIPLNTPKAFNFLLEQLYVFEPEKKRTFVNLLKTKGLEYLIKSFKDNLDKIEDEALHESKVFLRDKKIQKAKVDINAIHELKTFLGDKEIVGKILLSLEKEEIKAIFSNSRLNELYNFWINVKLPELPRQFTEVWAEYLSERKKSISKWLFSQSLKLSELGRFIRITYWHKELQPTYNRFFFITPNYLNRLKECNLGEIAQFLIDIISINWKRNPSIGKIVGLGLIDPVEYFPLGSKGIIFDTDSFLRRKAKILVREGKVSQINQALFSVQGFHGIYSVIVENDRIKCSCPGHYKTKATGEGICEHSIAVLLLLIKNEFIKALERGIVKSSLKSIQKLLQVADELGKRDLAHIILRIIEINHFNLVEKIKEAELKDLSYFLWNMPFGTFKKYCDFVVKNKHNADLAKKVERTKTEDVIFLLWNLFEGNYMPLQVLDEKVLLLLLKREERIGEKLALIGLLDFIEPDLLRKLNYDVRSDFEKTLAGSRNKVKRWFMGRRKRRGKGLRINLRRGLFSTFLFLLGLRGLRKINERYCFEIISTLAPSYPEKLIIQLETELYLLEKIGKMNEKRKKLYLENINWLRSFKKEGV
jgi:hypothetical protein